MLQMCLLEYFMSKLDAHHKVQQLKLKNAQN